MAQLHCSFCGRREDQVKKLLTGPDGACICDECVETCSAIIHGSGGVQDAKEVQLLKPEEIKNRLDQ